MKKLNAKQLLLATAQVMEDHPERWTRGYHAVNRFGKCVAVEDASATRFCASGLMFRLMAEGAVDWRAAGRARDHFLRTHRQMLTFFNDRHGRLGTAKMLRAAAATL